MAKDGTGKLWPFYMRGIETGFWDTRKDTTNYDKIFETYHKMGAMQYQRRRPWLYSNEF